MKKHALVFILFITGFFSYSQNVTEGSVKGNSFQCAYTGATFSVSSSTNTTSYIWQLPKGWTGSSTTNSILVFSNSRSGTISVTSKNSFENINAAVFVNIIDCSVGISKYGISGFDGIIDIYPNPNFNNFYIDYNGDLAYLTVSVTNLLGQEVYKSVLTPNFKNKIVLNLDDGYYFLKIYDFSKYLVLFKKINLN